MSAPRRRRRELLLAAAAGVVALPATARAGTPGEGTVLTRLIGREQAAVRAYGLSPAVPRSMQLSSMRDQDAAHADALATELAAVGLARPRPPRLQGVAAQLAAAHDLHAALSAAVDVERKLVDAYQAAVPLLPDAKIATTVATILASHAQHWLIAQRLAGRDPLAAG